jgi:ribosomal protein S18 acetylase RimI-like enzyme
MVPDAATLRRILYADPVWSAYAIADLQPALQPLCRWFVGRAGVETEAGEGLVLLYGGLEPAVLFATGPAAAVADALAQADAADALPDSVYLSIRPEHEEALERWYAVTGSDDRRPMVRMHLRAVHHIHTEDRPDLVRLHADDASRLARLYAEGGDFAPDAFAPAQLEGGVFYGIEEPYPPHALLAAGGTHVVDWEAGVGAIGNFYTASQARGRGLAGILLNAVVRDLRAGYVDTIVLSVDQRNSAASRLYERHGFSVYCPFLEGVARKVASHPPQQR